MTATKTASDIIESAPMGFRQWGIVVICIGVLALDGYDVLSIAFAAPGLAEEWGLSKAALGIILPLELVGMALGSVVLGGFADSRGRRPTLLLGLLILTLGMAAAGIAPNVWVLGLARVFTGLGIGGLLATATATSSDFCNAKYRAVAVVLVAGGFPLGVYIGATFLAPLLASFDWRITFYLGSAMSLISLPAVYFWIPESIAYLERAGGVNAQSETRRVMRSLGHPTPDNLATHHGGVLQPVGMKSLFAPSLISITVLLSIAYFGTVGTYYYFVKWMPTIIADLGYSISEATRVLGFVSLGGVVGSVGVGLLIRVASIRPVLIVCLVSAAISIVGFPYFTDTLESMRYVGFLAGIFIFAALSGYFGLFAVSFPSSLLGSGSGLVLAIGRGGAVLGPLIPGFLFTAGFTIKTVALIMASGVICAAIAVALLRSQSSAFAGAQLAD